MMNAELGRQGISPRVLLEALIIKHKEKLDDCGVIAAIQENSYMQFFVGLKEFDPDPVFDPSLFVEIRKRVGAKTFDELNAELIRSTSKKEVISKDYLPQNQKETTPILEKSQMDNLLDTIHFGDGFEGSRDKLIVEFLILYRNAEGRTDRFENS